MEPRMVTKPAFTVVGVPFAGTLSNAPYEEGQGNNEIGKAWDEFHRRMGEIRHATGPAIGLCFGMPGQNEPWYIAGMQVERAEEVPTGMMRMSVPEQSYAVFDCTLGTLWATYSYIAEEWQSRTGRKHADGPDFEVYDEEFDPQDGPNGRMKVYWPIK
jgi:predicted transcriptional regulator YdeE